LRGCEQASELPILERDCRRHYTWQADRKWKIQAMTKNPIFVLGMQRSGTNYVFDVLKQFTGIVAYNEDNPKAFNNFLLAEPPTIQGLVDLHPDKVCLFKSISETIKILTLRRMFPNAGLVFTCRFPQQVVNSYAYEFSNHMHVVNHIINFDFFHDRLKTATGTEFALPRVTKILEHFVGRFSSIADGADKIALYWSLFHLSLLESGLLDVESLILVSYKDITANPERFRNFIQRKFFSDREFVGELPPVTSRKLFFSERISPDVLEICGSVYEELQSHLTPLDEFTPPPEKRGTRGCPAEHHPPRYAANH
jgi:hypothetical protein